MLKLSFWAAEPAGGDVASSITLSSGPKSDDIPAGTCGSIGSEGDRQIQGLLIKNEIEVTNDNQIVRFSVTAV